MYAYDKFFIDEWNLFCILQVIFSQLILCSTNLGTQVIRRTYVVHCQELIEL